MNSVHRFDIIPHQGIGPVRLGMARAEVEAALAPLHGAMPALDKGLRMRCFFGASLQVAFGTASGRAQFIGVSNNLQLLCLFQGKDVFDLVAPELFKLIASGERSASHTYRCAEYVFPDQIVSLYEAAEQYDRKGGYTRLVFGQVGVGNAEYQAAVDATRARRDARRQANPRQANQALHGTGSAETPS